MSVMFTTGADKSFTDGMIRIPGNMNPLVIFFNPYAAVLLADMADRRLAVELGIAHVYPFCDWESWSGGPGLGVNPGAWFTGFVQNAVPKL